MEEVKRVLDCVHRFEYQVCLKTIYACGLRLLEGTGLRVKAIDSDRKMLHVVEGKGGKDRYVPLPEHTLMLLRHLWVTHAQHDVEIPNGCFLLETSWLPLMKARFKKPLRPHFARVA